MNKAEEVQFGNEKVERVRRIHQNDLENILPFLVVGLYYVLADPNALAAKILIGIAVGARFAHTLVYFFAVPQPARTLCWAVHYLITCYMAIKAVVHFCC